MPITEAQLRGIMPRCRAPQNWVGPLNLAMQRFDIDSLERIAAFLAQVARESAELDKLVEELNYTAIRAAQVWPTRFPTVASAAPYERRPQALANFVYANRLGNGKPASGDGWRFRGRGLIQTTGRGNYRATGHGIGMPLETSPELLEQPGAAALSAAWFWKARGLNELADNRNDDNDDQDFATITRLINGSTRDLKRRKEYWLLARTVLL